MLEHHDTPAAATASRADEAGPGDAAPLLARLLGDRPSLAPAQAPGPGQIVLGTLQTAARDGRPMEVQVESLGTVTIAHSLVPPSGVPDGATVALSLLGPREALLLGVVWQATAGHEAAAAPELIVDGERHVIEAATEIELRCGEAAIVLTADGRIQLRGTYITSHASATQRIVGGAVHVN